MKTLRLVVLSVLVAAGLDFQAQAAAAPVVTTAAATGLSNTVATLNGTVNPGGAETTAWFEWGLYAVNNTNLTASVAVGSGSVSVGLSAPLSGFTPGINYHGRGVASNALGVVRGLDVLFGSPGLTLNGAANLTIGYRTAFTDPGATATGAPLAISGGYGHSLALKSDGTVAAWGDNSAGQATIPGGLGRVVAIAGGWYHSLALKSDGKVAAWGWNNIGQTTLPAGLSNVVAIGGGGYHSLALNFDGTVAAWGDNTYGQMPAPAGLSNVVAIAGGGYHSLALKSDGTVAAWGAGSILSGDFPDYGQSITPVGLSNVVAIAGGYYHNLALKSDGTVVAWGRNNYGQTNIPVGLSNVVAIAGGEYHCLALKSDGTVASWGNNWAPVPVGLSNVVAISGGRFYGLALLRDGTVAGWGQTTIPVGLSNVPVTVGGSVDSNTPGTYTLTYTSGNSLGGVAKPVTRTVVVSPFVLPSVIALSATDISNTVASLNGTVNPGGAETAAWFEWGLSPFSNTNLTAPVVVGSGSVGVGSSASLSGLTPGVIYHARLVASNAVGVVRGLDVPFGSPALILNGAANLTIGYQASFTDPGATATGSPLAIAGGGNQSLALKSDGTIAAWGNNIHGQTTIPAGLSSVVAIAAGDSHSLALKSDGRVAAWGWNAYGQTTIPAGLSSVVAIAAGDNHSLALKSDGTVVAWGLNSDGQTSIPLGLSNVVAISGGASHSLALKSDGTVVAWGWNTYGQTNIPVGLGNVIAISGGYYHSLALKSDGMVAAWGWNSYGITTIPSGLSNVGAITGSAAGHSLALNFDGTVAAWGYNGQGQTTVPVGLGNVVAIAGGGGHSLALKSDGTIAAWGDGSSGQTTIPAGLRNVRVTVGGSVDVNAPGTYMLTYTSTNALGGVAAPVTRTVVVGPPPTPPLLTSMTRLGNGTFQFSFTNTPGMSFTLFASTNVALPFSSWSNLGPAVEGPAGQYQFTDPTATNSPQRFYGVRSP